MRPPKILLQEQVIVEPYLGNSAYGKKFGAPETVDARIEKVRRLIRQAQGRERSSEMTIWVDPEVSVPMGSRVTVEDDLLEVIGIDLPTSLGGLATLREVALGGTVEAS